MTAASTRQGPLPTFLILGAPKAGTTSLSGYLAEHPDVFVAPEKEIHFFDRHFERGVDWYRSRFAGATGEHAVGEASPTYMYRDSTLERIASVLREPRLLVMVRNPIDRAYSQWWWDESVKRLPPFADAVRAEMDGDDAKRVGRYLGRGRYLERLEKIAATFGRSSLLVVVMEEMTADPAAIYREVCRFLGVDASFDPPSLGRRINPAATVRFPWLLRTMNRLQAWRRLPEGWAAAIDRWNRPVRPYRPLDDALRTELRAWFAEDNAALARWLGRDLSIWNR